MLVVPAASFKPEPVEAFPEIPAPVGFSGLHEGLHDLRVAFKPVEGRFLYQLPLLMPTALQARPMRMLFSATRETAPSQRSSGIRAFL